MVIFLSRLITRNSKHRTKILMKLKYKEQQFLAMQLLLKIGSCSYFSWPKFGLGAPHSSQKTITNTKNSHRTKDGPNTKVGTRSRYFLPTGAVLSRIASQVLINSPLPEFWGPSGTPPLGIVQREASRWTRDQKSNKEARRGERLADFSAGTQSDKRRDLDPDLACEGEGRGSLNRVRACVRVRREAIYWKVSNLLSIL